MLMSSPVAHVCARWPTCCLVKMRYLPSKIEAPSIKHLRSHYGIGCQDALTRHSMYGERMEGTETPAAKPEYLSLWQLASLMAVASIPGKVERIIVGGQSTFHPVIVLFLTHFCHGAAPHFR